MVRKKVRRPARHARAQEVVRRVVIVLCVLMVLICLTGAALFGLGVLP